MADNSFCTVCARAAENNIIVDQDLHTNTFYAELFDVSEATVRRHYKHGPEPRLPGFKQESIQENEPASEKERREVREESTTGARSVEAVRDRPVTMADAREWLRADGDNPDDFNISIRSIAYGKDMFSNKMSAWPKANKRPTDNTEDLADIDPVEILRNIRNGVEPAKSDPHLGYDEGAFVLSLNDTQLGKSEGGGSVGTLERVASYVDMAAKRIDELRLIGRKLDTLVIIGGGDIVEGCTIFPNQSFTLDLDRRGQMNAAVTMILDTIDYLAPKFSRVIVLAARGNHGENRINGHKTTLYDNDDTLVFEMAKRATERDQALSHVEYIIAESEAGVYVDVVGWRLATTHGDVYAKGVPGTTNDKKAQSWVKNMAMARDPLGQADVLITHHFHHDKLSDWGACLWRQTPALDGGSEYFRQATGEYSLPGMLTFVMTPQSRYSDEAVLR